MVYGDGVQLSNSCVWLYLRKRTVCKFFRRNSGHYVLVIFAFAHISLFNGSAFHSYVYILLIFSLRLYGVAVPVPVFVVLVMSKRAVSVSMQRIGSWAISNLCDGQPRPVMDVVSVIPLLALVRVCVCT